MTYKALKHSPQRKDYSPLVLVVEEDEDTRLMLKYLLEIWKYRVIQAIDGDEAIRQAFDCQPDLILLNVKFNKCRDLNESRRMRELPEFAQSELIFICDYADRTVRASALAEGIGDILVKPIDFGELEKILDQRLRRRFRLIENPFKEVI